MSESGEVLARPAANRLLNRLAPASPRLASALADLSAAATQLEVGAAAAAHAAVLTAARGAAVGVLSRTRTELVLVGSVGYDCDSMAVGARLPMTADLPITEAARTGAAVVRAASGGGWVAVPLLADPAGPVGALLVSLDPSSPETDVELLSDLAGHARRALRRCPASDGDIAIGDTAIGDTAIASQPAADAGNAIGATDAAGATNAIPATDGTDAAHGTQATASAVTGRRTDAVPHGAPRIAPYGAGPTRLPGRRGDAGPAPLRAVPAGRPSAPPHDGPVVSARQLLSGLDIAVRIDPLLQRGGARTGVGGDLVEIVADGRGGGWIVVADACGMDATASSAAALTGLLVRALGPHVDDPVTLLTELDALLESERVSRYVTALAMHVTADPAEHVARLRVASAGHPLPFVTPSVETPELDARMVGLPLNLGLGEPLGAATLDITLPAGQSLLCFTDGLTDRRDRSVPADIVEDVFHRAVDLFSDATMALETVFDVLAGGQGAPGDDAAAALIRVL